MIELDPTERLAVLRTDLEQWKRVLQLAYGMALALDLIDGNREGRPDKQTSRLTRLAAQSHNRIEGYLEQDNDELLPTE